MKYVTSVERLAIERGMARGKAEGKAEGKAKGRTEGRIETLTRQLTRRFGPLPEWAAMRLQSATSDQLDQWTDGVLEAQTLSEVFGGH